MPSKLHVHADDELDRMRQQMAETASLLVSAAYEQPQVQLQHCQVKLTKHLADPNRPLDLALETPGTQREAPPEEPSGEQAGAQLSGVVDSPPRTPGQDAAGRAARAKRVASSREVRCTVWRIAALSMQSTTTSRMKFVVEKKASTTFSTTSRKHVGGFPFHHELGVVPSAAAAASSAQLFTCPHLCLLVQHLPEQVNQSTAREVLLQQACTVAEFSWWVLWTRSQSIVQAFVHSSLPATRHASSTTICSVGCSSHSIPSPTLFTATVVCNFHKFGDLVSHPL